MYIASPVEYPFEITSNHNVPNGIVEIYEVEYPFEITSNHNSHSTQYTRCQLNILLKLHQTTTKAPKWPDLPAFIMK